MPSPLRDKAQGRWRDLLMGFGVDRSYLSGKHGPCPICLDGKDKFRFDNDGGAGTFFCNSCGSGDGFQLLMKLQGISFKEAAKLVEEHIGAAGYEQPKAKMGDKLRKSKLNKLWRSSQLIDPADPVGRYLEARLGQLDLIPGALRTVSSLEYRDGSEVKGSWPAMIAMVMEPAPNRSERKVLGDRPWDPKPVTIHRTWVSIHGDGEKAPLADPRRLMAGDMPAGSFIPLSPSTSVMGIAEGIETALSVTRLFGVNCWAAINANNLEHWNPPPGTEHVVVFGDADKSYTGQAAAYALAKRLTVNEKIKTQVRIPPQLGTDWNDVLRASGDDKVRVLPENSRTRALA